MGDLAELLTQAAVDAPDHRALVEADGRSLTWAELDNEVGRVATGLGDAGIVAGHRVLLAMANRAELVAAYFGVLRAQAVAVPVNPRATISELARMLADSGVRLAFVDVGTADAVRAAKAMVDAGLAGERSDLDEDVISRAAPTSLVTVGEAAGPGEVTYDGLLAAEPRSVPPLLDPHKLAVLLYTSGTSGRPRAAMLSHRALLANVEQVALMDPPMMRADDVVLGVLPLFHVYGLNAVLGAAVRHRATLVLQQVFDPVGTLYLVARHACTVLPLAPAAFPHWLAVHDLRDRLASVRLVLSGSAALPRDVVEKFAAVTGITVHQGYGLTEASPVVTSTRHSAEDQPGSVGSVIDGVELRLVDEQGHVVEGDDPGEIWVRGDNLFSDYWPDGSGGPDAEGWWATGDVGILDPRGDLLLLDRVKELVVVSGFNVYPVEVEHVIRETGGVTEAAVRRRCESRLARFKQPTEVHVVDRLPQTVTGKVAKGRLREGRRRRSLGLLE